MNNFATANRTEAIIREGSENKAELKNDASFPKTDTPSQAIVDAIEMSLGQEQKVIKDLSSSSHFVNSEQNSLTKRSDDHAEKVNKASSKNSFNEQVIDKALGTIKTYSLEDIDALKSTDFKENSSVFHYLVKDRQLNDLSAQELFYIGSDFYFGLTVIQDISKALYALDLAYQKKSDDAAILLAVIYFLGTKVERNLELAEKLIQEPLKYRDPDALLLLAGINYEKNQFNKVAPILQELALDYHNDIAQHALGVLFFDGKGVDQNYEQAFHYFYQAATNGNPKAMLELARMYKLGLGIEANNDKAAWYAKRSCDCGYMRACNLLQRDVIRDNK